MHFNNLQGHKEAQGCHRKYYLINILQINLQFLHAHWNVFLLLFESLCSSNLLWQLIKCKKKNITCCRNLYHTMCSFCFVLRGSGSREWCRKRGERVREAGRGVPWCSLCKDWMLIRQRPFPMLTAVHIRLVSPCNDTHVQPHTHTLQIQGPALITQTRLLLLFS